MKKVLVSLCCVFLVLALLGAYSETIQYGYAPLRSNVTADDTPLDGTTASYTYQWADKPSTAVEVQDVTNNVQIYFYGTNAANEACAYVLYAYKQGGPVAQVCSGTATLGTAVTGETLEFFADTITATDVWPTTVTVSDSGNNGVCTLSFDSIGYEYFFCEVLPTSGTCAEISAVITSF